MSGNPGIEKMFYPENFSFKVVITDPCPLAEYKEVKMEYETQPVELDENTDDEIFTVINGKKLVLIMSTPSLNIEDGQTPDCSGEVEGLVESSVTDDTGN